MFDAINDTIVAVSSASGHGVRGIVRLSGPDAIAVAAGLFVADGETCLSRQPGFRRIPGMVLLDAAHRLPAEVYLFRAPRSYTRQDCVEIHTIGSPAVLAMVLDGARSAGARLAQPGEFTARAFLSGAMDLSQAEAVAAAIGARSDRQLRAARKLQEGDLSRRITRWRARLTEVTALIEADIDFADEPIEFITPGALRAQLSSLARQIEALRAGADSAERFDVLPTVLLIGRPNAGKSSLLNALSGLDRAICSAISGTTRDIVSAPIKLGTTEAMLLDAAGVHEDADALMREAQARVLSAAEHVDLLCLVIDVATPPETSAFDCLRSAPTTPCILVANKIDLLDAETRDHRQTVLTQAAPANVMSVCAVSATEGTGLEHLRDVLAGQLGHRDDLAEEKSIVLSARQRGCLASASQALGRAVTEAEQIGETVDRAEVLALELREALDALGELVGAVTTEDLLNTIFASFCIGK